MVRCKFECQSVTKRKGWSGHAVLHDAEFTAVTDQSPVKGSPHPGVETVRHIENKEFFVATPSGKLTVATVVPDVFEVGKSYYLDITPAE
jgi:hypothetical protein